MVNLFFIPTLPLVIIAIICGVYMIQDGLVNQTFDIVEEVNAETLTDCLIKNAVLKSDASVVSFENRNGAGTLELKVAGKTYGPMEFTYEYDYH